jgi:hypothetical protein
MTVWITYETVMRGFISVLFIAILAATLPGYALAHVGSAGQREQNERVIREIGVGDKARVEVKLKDGSKVKGVIRSATSDRFVVEQEKTRVDREIAFADVETAKKPRSGLKPRTWAIIGGAAAAAVVVGITVLYPVLCDGGAGC